MSPSRHRDDDHNRLRAVLWRGDPAAGEASMTSEELHRMRREILAAVRSEASPAWGRLALAGAAALLLAVAVVWWEAPRPPAAGRASAPRAAGAMAALTPLSPNSPHVPQAAAVPGAASAPRRPGVAGAATATSARGVPVSPNASSAPIATNAPGISASPNAPGTVSGAGAIPASSTEGAIGAGLGPDPGGQTWARAEIPAPPDDSEVPVCEAPEDCRGHQIEFSTASGLRVIWVLPQGGLGP